MASKQFQAELLQFKKKFEDLYREAQALLLRHGADSPHAAKMIMPHLETAQKNLNEIVNPPTQTGE